MKSEITDSETPTIREPKPYQIKNQIKKMIIIIKNNKKLN